MQPFDTVKGSPLKRITLLIILGLITALPLFAWEDSKPNVTCGEPEKRLKKVKAKGDTFDTYSVCWGILNTCTPTNKKEREFIKHIDELQVKLGDKLADEATDEMERNGYLATPNSPLRHGFTRECVVSIQTAIEALGAPTESEESKKALALMKKTQELCTAISAEEKDMMETISYFEIKIAEEEEANLNKK